MTNRTLHTLENSATVLLTALNLLAAIATAGLVF
jgi:hypothetical protein